MSRADARCQDCCARRRSHARTPARTPARSPARARPHTTLRVRPEDIADSSCQGSRLDSDLEALPPRGPPPQPPCPEGRGILRRPPPLCSLRTALRGRRGRTTAAGLTLRLYLHQGRWCSHSAPRGRRSRGSRGRRVPRASPRGRRGRGGRGPVERREVKTGGGDG